MPTLLRPDLIRLDESLGHEAAVLRMLADITGQGDRCSDVGALTSDAMDQAEPVLPDNPHGNALLVVRSAAVSTATLALVRLTTPVSFGPDGSPADLVVLLAVPVEDEVSGRQLLPHLTEVLSQPEVSAALRHAETSADAVQQLETALGSEQPPHPTSPASGRAAGESWGGRARRVLMTGVSYMIPFVAGGGLLIALGYLLGGYDIADSARDIVNRYDLVDLPDPARLGLGHVAFDSPMMAYLGAMFSILGTTAFTLFVPAMAGYIAYAIADRPGIAPGFVMGALAVDLVGSGSAQSGFLGAIVGGVMAGVVANWVGRWTLPPWARGLRPVMLVPLVTTAICGTLMIAAINRPLSTVTRSVTEGLNGLSGGSLVVLGVVLGLMMAFDIGGPLNKTAYTFAVTGVSGAVTLAGDSPQLQVMAAVMLAGMTPPLALAVATRVRPSLFTSQERETGKAAAALGAVFITEGAIPYAAADPLRVIPAIMTGSAVTGGVSMALGVTSRAPHGGFLALFSVGDVTGFCLALLAGVGVTTLLVCALKSVGTPLSRV
ncbi:MAG TPA: fructose-specific PTS transporter subunit EIIC [Ornithinimicrobium sp.]|uniref:PTS fructose transporter subunit IIABC n=1 Tax=Ornithinimicrobium sp. TaxID=1977084 RepID=UPI002B47895A|nr:fructose-specific PTS transporter subunit EIIC [Ornithinimicrobium sp.]HKJ11930.1 fructose-specific PTS transporter subunit EIIC [Ornithinimicrobium sp.]